MNSSNGNNNVKNLDMNDKKKHFVDELDDDFSETLWEPSNNPESLSYRETDYSPFTDCPDVLSELEAQLEELNSPGLIGQIADEEYDKIRNRLEIETGHDPVTVNPYYVGFKRHKNETYRNHLCIPKQNMYKICSFGGWEYFRVYVYILSNHNKNYSFQTSLKMICNAIGIKKNMKETMLEMLFNLQKLKIINYSFITDKCGVDAPILITLQTVEYPYQYFYVRDKNMEMTKTGKGGWIMFSIFCLMEYYRINKIYNSINYEEQRKCIISQDTISRFLKLSRSTVIKYINQLILEGYLSLTHQSFDKNSKKYFCNIYHLFDHDTRYQKAVQRKIGINSEIANLMKDYGNDSQNHPIIHALESMMNLRRDQLPAMISGDGIKMIWQCFKYTKNTDSFKGYDEAFAFDVENWRDYVIEKYSICDSIITTTVGLTSHHAFRDFKKILGVPINGFDFTLVKNIIGRFEYLNRKNPPVLFINLNDPPMGKDGENYYIKTFINDFNIKANNDSWYN